MGLLDFLRPTDKAAFKASATPPTKAKGGSGRYHTDGYLDLDEINADLQGRSGLEQFYKMWLSDPDCRRAITLCVNPIVAGTWIVEPYAEKDQEPTAEDVEIARFVEWNLFEAMRPKLPSHLWTALTVAARDGFAPFEQLYRLTTWNGRPVYALKTLDLRLPRSVDRWVESGSDLIGIEQHAPGLVNGQLWARTQIPAADLLYYRFGSEGNNWEGQSLLRPAYKHWRFKDGLEVIDAIGHERTAIGIPSGYPPEGASAEALAAFDEFLTGIKASDTGFFRAPGPHAQYAEKGHGWFWEFVTPGRSVSGQQALAESLSYHRDGISAVVIAEFMRLGQNGEGARATADVQQDPFWMLADTLAQIIVADTINEQLIPRLVGFNFDTDRFPRVNCSLIDSTSLLDLGDYIHKLAGAGALRTEPTLEAYLRERADLPEADEKAIAEQAENDLAKAERELEHATMLKQAAGDPEAKKPGAPGQPTGKKQLGRQPRDLRVYEQHMSLDRIESAIDTARDRLQTGAGDAARTLAAELADQAAKGKTLRHTDPPEALVDAVYDELLDLYTLGRETVREELDAQRLDPHVWATTLDNDQVDAKHLRARARTAAGAVRAAIVTALAAIGLRTGGRDLGALHTAGELAANQALRGQAMEHAAAVINAGRQTQAQADADDISGTYYTSILDGNRCDACATADDDVFRPLDSPVRLARVPPNPGCHGGGRCRCMEAYVLKTEAPTEMDR